MKPLRILIADDHALVRAGFRGLLEKMEGVRVVTEAASGGEALERIAECPPDIAFLDISMPHLNGLETALRIHKHYPAVSVVILSMHGNEEYVIQALEAGVRGFLMKNVSPAELESAVRAVSGGETYFSSGLSKQNINDYTARFGRPAGPPSGESGSDGILTPRQREILQLIAEGRTTKEIAVKLNVSVKTAETHRMQLMKRLNIHNVAGLVRYAIGAGMTRPGR